MASTSPAKDTRTSIQPSDIWEALSAAKRAMPELVKDSRNTHFKNTYLSLNGLLPVILPVLDGYGIDVVQVLDHVGEQPALRTVFRHGPSGTSIEGTCPMALAKVSPQDVGSATTYYRRYALMAGLNLLAEDDDGNASSGRLTTRKATREEFAAALAEGIPATTDPSVLRQPWEV